MIAILCFIPLILAVLLAVAICKANDNHQEVKKNKIRRVYEEEVAKEECKKKEELAKKNDKIAKAMEQINNL